MNVYCLECGCRLRYHNGRWHAVTSNAPCVSASRDHQPDPLDIALRRLNEAKDAVHAARADVIEAQAHYDYLKAVRVKR